MSHFLRIIVIYLEHLDILIFFETFFNVCFAIYKEKLEQFLIKKNAKKIQSVWYSRLGDLDYSM